MAQPCDGEQAERGFASALSGLNRYVTGLALDPSGKSLARRDTIAIMTLYSRKPSWFSKLPKHQSRRASVSSLVDTRAALHLCIEQALRRRTGGPSATKTSTRSIASCQPRRPLLGDAGLTRLVRSTPDVQHGEPDPGLTPPELMRAGR
jgi:hypothetical protein